MTAVGPLAAACSSYRGNFEAEVQHLCWLARTGSSKFKVFCTQLSASCPAMSAVRFDFRNKPNQFFCEAKLLLLPQELL
jgi:hypothetical protein